MPAKIPSIRRTDGTLLPLQRITSALSTPTRAFLRAIARTDDQRRRVHDPDWPDGLRRDVGRVPRARAGRRPDAA